MIFYFCVAVDNFFQGDFALAYNTDVESGSNEEVKGDGVSLKELDKVLVNLDLVAELEVVAGADAFTNTRTLCVEVIKI